MLVGRAWYHEGVWPAPMDDAISEAKAAWLVIATARTSDGSAVASWRRTEAAAGSTLVGI